MAICDRINTWALDPGHVTVQLMKQDPNHPRRRQTTDWLADFIDKERARISPRKISPAITMPEPPDDRLAAQPDEAA
jgi:hypothetical protein